MSQIFQIPVQLEFRPRKTPWQIVEARILGWCSQFEPKKGPAILGGISGFVNDWIVVEINADYWSIGARMLYGVGAIVEPRLVQMRLNQLPRDLVAKCGEPGRDAVIPDQVQEEKFRLLIADTAGEPTKKSADAKAMREHFFSLNDDTYSLLAFARRWGLWDSEIVWNYDGPGMFRSIDDPAIQCLFPYRIEEIQIGLRKALHGKPEAWLGTPRATIQTVQRDRTPYFFAEPANCLTAIEYTITLDHLSGAKFAVCAQPDCRTPFPIESEHERKYCSPRCAHLMAVRASRERAKLKAVQPKRRGK